MNKSPKLHYTLCSFCSEMCFSISSSFQFLFQITTTIKTVYMFFICEASFKFCNLTDSQLSLLPAYELYLVNMQKTFGYLKLLLDTLGGTRWNWKTWWTVLTSTCPWWTAETYSVYKKRQLFSSIKIRTASIKYPSFHKQLYQRPS